MALSAGDSLLNGHYLILRLLGRGGFGFVYQAQDTLLGEDVAIKELIPALVGDEAMLKRFLAEARATMRLTHKRIVRTHNVSSEGGNYYIVMEYMPGGSLEERLREQGALPVEEAVQVAADVSEGLDCAHEEGVVHCDLKPQNILFDADGRAKVADFGIAHVSGEMLTRTWHTPAGFVAGTLPYMSPEQTDGVRDDPRIDVYALGAVLYRMLTGRTYLDFDPRETPRSQADNVQRIYQEQPQPPSSSKRSVAPWLDAVVLKALAKRPEDRYANAGAMRTALLQQQPASLPLSPTKSTPARPAQTPTPSVRSAPSTKKKAPLPAWFWPTVGGTALLLVVLVIAIGAMLGGGDGAATAAPQQTRTAVAVVITVTALPPTRTPVPTSTPTRTDTPEPTATATYTRRPTGTPLPLTATDTPQLTATLAPTVTPTREAPQAGDTQTRGKDGMVMVYVPDGEFAMGSNSDSGRYGEMPQHNVYLDAFWIDRTAVTSDQFRKCVEAGFCPAPTMCDDGAPAYEDGSKTDHPVVCVGWDQARTYCEWAGARLPTEAEWEKAARGTDGRVYPWGSSFDGARLNSCDRNCEFDWKDSDVDDGYARTAPVGSYPAGVSPYGALDMAGNVWEWVADWWDPAYYASSPERNPAGPPAGVQRVLRGGAWGNAWYNVRAASRGYDFSAPRTGYIGFRCAGSP